MNPATHKVRLSALLAASCLLSACNSLPDWMGGDDGKAPLPGERIAILSESVSYKPDDTLAGITLTLPGQQANEAWPQAGGNAESHLVHPALAGEIAEVTHGRIGEGNTFEQMLFSPPVSAGRVLFAMDARGYVSAHDAQDIGRVFWTSAAGAEEDDDEILGGGLAYDNGRLFITTGFGKVVALSAEDGRELWKQNLGVPLRVAPKVAAGKVIALSVDNQTFSLGEEKGTLLWTHRGINESAGFIADVTPSISDDIIVAPHTSGEIVAVDAGSGQERWSDSLMLAKRTTASAIFAGIGGTPVIADGVVYAASSNGLLAATELTKGRRLWEQEISSDNMPWVAGDYVFVLTTSDALLALSRIDGRIKWIQQLQQYEDEEEKRQPLSWRGPVLAGGHLWVVGRHGVMLSINPETGATVKQYDVPDEVVLAPIVGNGTLYLLTRDATLYAYK